MDNINIAFCYNCTEKEPYYIMSRRTDVSVRGITFSYVEQVAICQKCDEEVYVPEVNDANVQSKEDAYRRAAHLITREEVNSILQKYQIGAGPLAKMMGFGDITINRYVSGQLPSKEHSEKLLEVLASHKKMEEYLEANKEMITPLAYSRCRTEIDKLNALYGDRKIELVTRYFLSKNHDITPMALQKLLYYAKAFFLVLYGEDFFVDTCQAWSRGPVFPEIYYQYREFGYDSIKNPDVNFGFDLSELTIRETNILDAIYTAFGIYSGTILSKFTHSEKPWITARGSLLPDDKGTTPISTESIDEYFKKVVEKYRIINPCDIVKYSQAMFEAVR